MDLFFSWEGRISRQAYFTCIICLIGYNFACMALGEMIGEPEGEVIATGLALASLYPLACLSIKRCHDRGKSGLWTLMCFVPLFGQIWMLLQLTFMQGSPRRNAYGRPVTF